MKNKNSDNPMVVIYRQVCIYKLLGAQLGGANM